VQRSVQESGAQRSDASREKIDTRRDMQRSEVIFRA